MADDDSSELSSISSLSPPPSEDESEVQLEEKHGILKFFHRVDKNKPAAPKESPEPSPPRPKREPSPPHEYVLADNPDIAFIVMFRARFTETLPKSLANFGPQELERDIVDSVPGERVEHFLCALLGLLLNRKQDVKAGHYNRALEEAVSTHKAQWARDWESKNPLAGGATFASMNPIQRLTLLRTLILWTLSSSDTVKAFVTSSYKNRQNEDINIPISVQPWGSDSNKRRYFLIEGLDDTSFRVYRESNPAGVHRTWWSVAGSIDELKGLAEKLDTQDGGPKARTLAQKMLNSIPRFEATEEKRRRREYRQMRKEQFKRPEPGFSMYEGRTRGKRMKYTYSDDEDEFYTDSTRRSTRNTRNHTPAEPSGPVVTASGRQVRAPTRLNVETGSNGDASASVSVQGDAQYAEDVDMDHDTSVGPTGRPRRSAAVNHGTNGWSSSRKRKSEEYESDEDEDSEPDLGDDEEEEHVPDESDEEEEDFEEEQLDDDNIDLEDTAPPRLVVKLSVKKAVDQDGKEKLVPSVTLPPKQNARPSHAHRNIVMSDDEESEGEQNTADTSLQPSEEKPTEESISVATKAGAPPTATPAKENVPPAPTSKPDATPPSAPSTSLAFRGSPEKAPLAPRSIDVGGRE
ncbi:hypothetical protein CONLIGDRAFT_628320 [Coniochaeta ligniaria NRRL 30616]|uniref:WHIM1 domain-containing protein n=1 Tax=Coniochaeta ligniaria NRRL 30616 TaxID=1408157 RepID=A0A1J7JVK9_9PEZI|nr:hypothetical protein CONLIGDRAFT_628320 [Coniochaeta ligniaria NRRL 30616]